MHKYNKILCAVDGSRFSGIASSQAVALAKSMGAEVVGLYVVDSHLAMRLGVHYGEALREMQEEGWRTLNDFQGLAQENGVEFTYIMGGGNPKVEIVNEAEKQGADLIVIGSHGHSALERTLLGSVSDYVVRHAKCSVLVARDPGNTT